MTLIPVMCRFCRILPVVAALVVAALVLSQPACADKRVALVVGNNDYRNVPRLLKAVNDAHTMAETLKQLGFTVMVAENQTRREFSESLLNFDNALQAGDTAFFFFSGHGFEIMGQNYLLPVDVPAATDGQAELVRDAAILADRIVERLQNRRVRTAILVFDACRNNPFERSGVRSLPGGGGLAPMTQLPEGVFSVFSAGPRQTALDRLSDSDSNPNSVFTRIFARELLKPGVSLVQVVQHTRRLVAEVAETVKHRQVPVYFDQMVDDVFLSGKTAETTPPVQQQQVAALNPPKTLEPPGVVEPPPTADPPRTAELPKVVDPPKRVDPPKVEPQKVAVLPPVSPPAMPVDVANAPIASFMRHNGGWTISLSFADPTLAISWRFGDSGEFHETGLLNVFDPRTRRRTPNSTISLPPDTPAGVIQIRYVDTAGVTQGPFPIRFEPMTALIQTQREILDMTASSWLGFREFNGLLLYYTHLVSYRCAIREVRLGIDSTMPDRVLELPPCDMNDPGSIPNNAKVSIQLPSRTQLVSVELIYRDGSASEIKTFRH